MTILNLRYVDYSVGAYGRAKADGITLQFICDDTGEIYHSFLMLIGQEEETPKNIKKDQFCQEKGSGLQKDISFSASGVRHANYLYHQEG